jgi:DNA-binding transcriptional ArsR family regulator
LIGPYKFLDYYEFEDAEIFFGRNLEIELLLSDIISARLVLLFARTGSGKTSLINAGIRPRLKKLNYETFYIRVERDPTESARVALRNENLLTDEVERLPLDEQLIAIVKKLEKPIVLFFDQFEEFFIYIVDEKSRNNYISSIARLYRNRDSGVHTVFSFREEFFVEMEAFRSEIPTIFHNESNLRLHWFSEDQARDAIAKPAEFFGAEIERDLPTKIVDDLRNERGVEPARLQIVCDTLWRTKIDNKMTVAAYDTLGGADRIVEKRLQEDIDNNFDDEQLRLLEKLLPELRTKIGIKTEPVVTRGRVFEQMLKPFKRGRTIDELVALLKVDESIVRALINKLKDLHLVKEVKRFDDVYLEWISDYMADLTDFLLNRVRAILLGRLLRRCLIRAETKREQLKRQEKEAQS